MKLLLLSAALLAASVTNAFTVNYDWGKVYTSSSKSTSTDDAVLTAEGNWYTVMRSDTPADLKWGGTALNLPADEGTVTAAKLLISKMDAQGNILWNITSTSGAFGADNGLLGIMPDGGAAIAFTVRKNSKDASINPLAKFVDAKGNTTSITIDGYPDAWVYVPMIMKFSADGEIEWVRNLKCEFPEIDSKVVAQPTYVRALTTDGEGNIYIGGLYQTALSFPTSATAWGGTITPVNIPAAWKGTSTNDGDMFIAKLDKDGFLVKTFTVDATTQYAGRDQVSCLSFSNGTLYWLGQVLGLTSGATYTIGTSTVTPSVTDAPKALETTIAGALSSDLTPKWTTTIPTEPNSSGSAVIQNKNLNIGTDAIYATGALNGCMKLGSTTIDSKETKLHGYIAAFDKETGAIKGGNVYGTAGIISGYYGALENTDNGHVIAYGYAFGQKILLMDYDASMANPVETTLIAGGPTTPWGCALNPATNQFLSLSRGKGKGTVLDNKGEIECMAQFTGAIAAFTFSDFKAPSGIEAVAADEIAAVNVYGTTGAAVFTASEACTVAIYSATGALVKSIALTEGTTTVELPAGFYIAAGQKFIVR